MVAGSSKKSKKHKTCGHNSPWQLTTVLGLRRIVSQSLALLLGSGLASQGRRGCMWRRIGQLVAGFESCSLLDGDCNVVSHANDPADTPRRSTRAAWQGEMILVGRGMAVMLHSTTSAPQRRRTAGSIGSSL